MNRNGAVDPPALAGDNQTGLAERDLRIPPHARGLKIGLFGGTFDPPHGAHRAACLIAMKRLKLDRVWWLVTPGNPLKEQGAATPLVKPEIRDDPGVYPPEAVRKVFHGDVPAERDYERARTRAWNRVKAG